MIHGKYIGQGGDLATVRMIRTEAFSDPEHVSYDLHEERDPMALNAIVDEDGTPVGAGRLVLDLIEDRFYVDNICVLPEHRGKQYGEFILRMLADKADQCNAKEIWAEVPEYAKGFFEKLFFENAGGIGDYPFMHAGIERFHSCCSHAENAGLNGNDCGRDCSSCSGCENE